jgi:hypothetical protein
MPLARDVFRQWVEHHTPPTTEESRRWWADIEARVAGQTPEQMELGRQAWAAEKQRDAQIRRERMGLGSPTRREQRQDEWFDLVQFLTSGPATAQEYAHSVSHTRGVYAKSPR